MGEVYVGDEPDSFYATKHVDLLDLIRERGILRCKPIRKRAPITNKEFIKEEYPIPIKVYRMFQGLGRNVSNLDEPLTAGNYADRLKNLLWIEEGYKNVDLHRYEIYTDPSILFKTLDGLFKLCVDEQILPRLSLIPGSRMLLIDYNEPVTIYQAHVHAIGIDFIIIKTHNELHQASELPRLVAVFEEERIPYRRCHNGVARLSKRANFADIVFPPEKERLAQPKMDDMTLIKYNATSLNDRQKAAVCGILRATCRPAPYIVFGPPGTGKTTTIVEAIIQVYDCREKSYRILVCGNSNLCTDHIAECLLNSGRIPKEKIHRFYASYREQLIPETLAPISSIINENSPTDCKNYRIVLSTCNLAAALFSVSNGVRFDYIFIDEAGHSNEPETLIPINFLAEDGCIILAGDRYQLGPACSCPLARRKQFDISMLERLMRDNVVYKELPNRKVFDKRYITMLQRCYRADKRLLALNNELFYELKLILEERTPKSLLKKMDFKWPLVFHSARGEDYVCKGTKSRYNLNEAQMCVEYVKKFYTKANYNSDQLGVITYYKAQKYEIIKMFESKQVEPCKVDTIDGFQGDEREVIIISTVRTDTGRQMRLSFMFDPKRFNVATSRAKHMLIVIGDDNLLDQDHDHWKHLIEKTKQKKTFIQ